MRIKKTLVAAATVVTMLAAVNAWAGQYDYLFTDTLVNGMGFFEENETTVVDTECYAYGCMDALFIVNNDAMIALYPHTTKKDILNAVKKYYTENPAQRSRPVVQVLIAGCK